LHQFCTGRHTPAPHFKDHSMTDDQSGSLPKLSAHIESFLTALDGLTAGLSSFAAAAQAKLSPAKLGELSGSDKSDPSQVAKPQEASNSGNVLAGMDNLVTGMKAATSGLQAGFSALTGSVSGVLSGVAGMAKGLDMVVPGLGELTGVVAGAVQAIVDIPQKVMPFVEALSPALLITFNQAMRDLNATIGTAFAGMFDQLAGTMNMVAGQLLPIMEMIRPVVEKATDVIGGILVTVVKAAADMFTQFLPVINTLQDAFAAVAGLVGPAIELAFAPLKILFSILEPVIKVVVGVFQGLVAVVKLIDHALRPVYAAFDVLSTIASALVDVALAPFTKAMNILTPIMDALTQHMDVMMTVFNTLVDTVTAFIGSLTGGDDLKSVTDGIVNALQQMTKYILLFVGNIAKFFGADSFLDSLIKNLTPKTHGATGAMQGVGMKGFEQIGRDLALAAVQGAKAEDDTKKSQSQWLEEAVGELKGIRDGKQDLEKLIDKAVDK